MCADLKGMLNATVWKTGAPTFVPYLGSAHSLASPGDSAFALLLPPLVPPAPHIKIDYDAFTFALTQEAIRGQAHSCLDAIVKGAPAVMALTTVISQCQLRVHALLHNIPYSEPPVATVSLDVAGAELRDATNTLYFSM